MQRGGLVVGQGHRDLARGEGLQSQRRIFRERRCDPVPVRGEEFGGLGVAVQPAQQASVVQDVAGGRGFELLAWRRQQVLTVAEGLLRPVQLFEAVHRHLMQPGQHRVGQPLRLELGEQPFGASQAVGVVGFRPGEPDQLEFGLDPVLGRDRRLFQGAGEGAEGLRRPARCRQRLGQHHRRVQGGFGLASGTQASPGQQGLSGLHRRFGQPGLGLQPRQRLQQAQRVGVVGPERLLHPRQQPGAGVGGAGQVAGLLEPPHLHTQQPGVAGVGASELAGDAPQRFRGARIAAGEPAVEHPAVQGGRVFGAQRGGRVGEGRRGQIGQRLAEG